MNLLNFLGPASAELQAAIQEAGFTELKDYMDSRMDKDNGTMSVEERVSYYLGQVNLIAEITSMMESLIGEEE
mgnify:CR=1 FL=1